MMELFQPVERRSGLSNPTKWLIDAFGGGVTKSGARVNADSALEWVFDAVQVRSQTIASLPLKLFRRSKTGDKEPASDHPLYRLLQKQPHPDLTSYEFRHLINSHLDLRGNAYAQIVRDNAGRIRRLVPLHPDRVMPKRLNTINADGTRPIVYEVTNEAFGGMATLSSFDVLHFRGYCTDGVTGISPIRIKCETLGLAMAANEHAARSFSNGAKPGGVLEYPGKLGDNGAKNIRRSWQEVHGGAENVGKVAILEEGMKFHSIGLSHEDAQLLETRKYSKLDIASMYRVPPKMIGAEFSGATYSNVESQGIDFVKDFIPTVTSYEQRLDVSLLTEEEQAEFFFKFNVAGLMRGDLPSRYNAYRIGLGRAGEPGWITVNDIRESEDMNRVEGGDSLFSGISLDASSTAKRAIAPLLVDALGRAFRKEAKAVRAILRKAEASELEKFYSEHRRYLLETLAPVFVSARALSLEIGSAETLADAAIRDSRIAITTAGAEPEQVLTSWETTRAANLAANIIA